MHRCFHVLPGERLFQRPGLTRVLLLVHISCDGDSTHQLVCGGGAPADAGLA